MFGLMMCEDRVSMQPRYRQIVDGLHQLPSEEMVVCVCYCHGILYRCNRGGAEDGWCYQAVSKHTLPAEELDYNGQRV